MQPSTPCFQHQQLTSTMSAGWAKRSFSLFMATFLWADFFLQLHCHVAIIHTNAHISGPRMNKRAIFCILMPTPTTNGHHKHAQSEKKLSFPFSQPLFCQMMFFNTLLLKLCYYEFGFHSLNTKVSEKFNNQPRNYEFCC